MDGTKEIHADARDLYFRDFAEWCAQQSAFLGNSALGTPDWENIREEIEGLAARDRKELQSRIVRIIEHLLKLDYSKRPEPRGGWTRTLRDQRLEIALLLGQSPSLTRLIPGMIDWGYPRARRMALDSIEEYEPENAVDISLNCPYGPETILGDTDG